MSPNNTEAETRFFWFFCDVHIIPIPQNLPDKPGNNELSPCAMETDYSIYT